MLLHSPLFIMLMHYLHISHMLDLLLDISRLRLLPTDCRAYASVFHWYSGLDADSRVRVHDLWNSAIKVCYYYKYLAYICELWIVLII